ncbi:MAG: LPXTG cell wall anchor domain-containing protein, partial [Firmicutes bacterium]|nr:LPXTG cell wall anchor domain-containing protein [Bacillota bacterium]
GRGDLPFTGGNEAAVPILGLMLLGVASWLRRRKG